MASLHTRPVTILRLHAGTVGLHMLIAAMGTGRVIVRALTVPSVTAGSAAAASQAKVSVRSNRSTMGWALKSAQKMTAEGAHPPDDHVAGLPKKVPLLGHVGPAHRVRPQPLQTSCRLKLPRQTAPGYIHERQSDDCMTRTCANCPELTAQHSCFQEQAVLAETGS